MVFFLRNSELDLYSCASLFLKIQNPKSTNLAGSLDGAPIHNTISKTKTLFRDQSILQRSFTQLAFDASLVFTDCSAIATATCDLRARCAAAVRSHNTTPPLRPRGGLTPLGGRHMVAEQAQKRNILDLDICWLQKHNSGRNSHTEVQVMVYLSSAPHSYAVFDSATAVSWRKLQKTTSPGTLHGRCTHSKFLGLLEP